MDRAAELRVEDRVSIEALHADGLSNRKIAKNLKVSYTTVSRTLSILRETGSHESRARSGRPSSGNTRHAPAPRLKRGKKVSRCALTG